MTGLVPRTRAAASAEPGLRLWPLAPPGAPGRTFRIRHVAAPPFQWELHLRGGDGRGLILSLPRGLPWAAGEARLAEPIVEIEAAGRAPVWDEGVYRLEAWSDDVATIMLEGTRVRGRYALERAGAKTTLRRLDEAAVRPFPDRILPMLAHAAPYPENEADFAFELKWDGIRAIAYLDRGRVTLRSRNLNDLTAQYPELHALGAAYAHRRIVLDGEIVAPDEKGRPSFQRLQNRLGVVQRGLAQRRSEAYPIVYIAFDVLYVDGRDTMSLPYEERRAILDELQVHGDAWRTSPAQFGDGRGLLAMEGFEGVVAKRLGSPYEPGARSRAWIKVKRQRRQELVIGGWSAGRGSRAGRIGSILVGYYEPSDDEEPARFRYAGSVGTGFSQATLDGILRLLAPDVRATSPFADPVDKKDVTFVEPRYVAEFEFTEWTSDGKLRHPSFKGLREDKDPRQVTREET